MVISSFFVGVTIAVGVRGRFTRLHQPAFANIQAESEGAENEKASELGSDAP